MIKNITLTNFLSYGAKKTTIDLRPLNVIIGTNGSGKSNLIEAFELLHATPHNLLKPIRDGGGILDWLWKGNRTTSPPTAKIDVVIDHPTYPELPRLRYTMSFTAVNQRFEILDERIERESPDQGHEEPYFYYKLKDGHGVLNVHDGSRQLKHEAIDPTASILAQRKDPDQYPELTHIGLLFSNMRLYREWSFGRYTMPRLPQRADLSSEYLEPDTSNLGLVLNRLRRDPNTKQRFLQALRTLYRGIDDFDVSIEAGTVQVFFQEGNHTIPATRLSDGTLRYLCLLAILCHPSPGYLVCIEEPELGLHPDMLPTMAELLQEASTRTQVIVTTHSDILVNALSNCPEAVLVAERTEHGTTLERLDAQKLKPWLEEYRLGQLWTRGNLGGTRW